jgi:hypothetical protein
MKPYEHGKTWEKVLLDNFQNAMEREWGIKTPVINNDENNIVRSDKLEMMPSDAIGQKDQVELKNYDHDDYTYDLLGNIKTDNNGNIILVENFYTKKFPTDTVKYNQLINNYNNPNLSDFDKDIVEDELRKYGFEIQLTKARGNNIGQHLYYKKPIAGSNDYEVKFETKGNIKRLEDLAPIFQNPGYPYTNFKNLIYLFYD